ncbi:MAG: glycosyltransferase family 4 protein [Elusimicrobia bacterium]|nr:glycosyltransferase family 4 protein [Elusimicrobiota bacterium]
MGRPVRIAISSRQVAGVTGTTTTIMEHARRLAERGCEVHVYGEKLDQDRLAAAGAVAHRLVGCPWGSQFKRRLFSWVFDRAVRRQRFDLVWGHGDTLSQDVLSLHNCVHAAHEAVHGAPLPASSGVGLIHRRVLTERGFRLLIANSLLMKKEVVARFGVPEDAVTVIHPGHDPGRFKPEDRGAGLGVRRELGVRDDETLVGLISSGDFAKRGVRRFLEALAAAAPARKKGLHALVMGRETKLAPYERLAAETGLGARVHFVGPTAQVERFYHALDVYVHPALYEEFGQSVQEAMACGVAVLTNARVGAAELLAGEDWGLVLPAPGVPGAGVPLRSGLENGLPSPDVPLLTAAIERLAGDADLRRRWGARCRRAAKDNTWERNFALSWEACLKLLASPAGR